MKFRDRLHFPENRASPIMGDRIVPSTIMRAEARVTRWWKSGHLWPRKIEIDLGFSPRYPSLGNESARPAAS